MSWIVWTEQWSQKKEGETLRATSMGEPWRPGASKDQQHKAAPRRWTHSLCLPQTSIGRQQPAVTMLAAGIQRYLVPCGDREHHCQSMIPIWTEPKNPRQTLQWHNIVHSQPEPTRSLSNEVIPCCSLKHCQKPKSTAKVSQTGEFYAQSSLQSQNFSAQDRVKWSSPKENLRVATVSGLWGGQEKVSWKCAS